MTDGLNKVNYFNQHSQIYLRPKVTLHFAMLNISILVLILSQLNNAVSYQHLPNRNS